MRRLLAFPGPTVRRAPLIVELYVSADYTGRDRLGPFAVLLAAVAAIAAPLLLYSQKVACFGDEGFHLLAARLINAGKRPYLDFFYQHPPLYAYVTAGWLRLFGDSWRSAHVLSTLFTVGCIALVAEYVFSRSDKPGWPVACAVSAALLVGLQLLVVQFGTIGQPYGMCLFLGVAAFRLTVASASQQRKLLLLGAGFCSGAAAASSLLSAPVPLVLLVWLARYAGQGKRFKTCALFLAGAVFPCLPLLWLAAQGPRQAFFDVVLYHAFYRSPSFLALIRWDLSIVTGWPASGQALLRAFLAAMGLLFVAGQSDWEGRRQEVYLCGWLTAALALYISTAHPIFPQYFVMLVPFISILGSIGIYAIGSTLSTSRATAWPALLVAGLLFVGLAKPTYHERRTAYCRWTDLERLGREINRLTPKNGLLWAPEGVYFAAGWLPPPGLENSNSLGLRLSPAQAAPLHAVLESQVRQWVAEARFDTVCTCAHPETIADQGLPGPYPNTERMDGCYIFWRTK